MHDQDERKIKSALLDWERARKLEDAGKYLLALRAYVRGWGTLLSYVLRARTPILTPAYYALGALLREASRLVARPPAIRNLALQYARMSLAASHLADPTRGDVSLIERAVREGRDQPLYQLSLDPHGQLLTPELRIAGAAEAREVLAATLNISAQRTRANVRARWLIGSGAPLGRGTIGLIKLKHRYQQAVLPSCAGLDEHAEQRRLTEEADAILTELRRVSPAFTAEARPQWGQHTGR